MQPILYQADTPINQFSSHNGLGFFSHCINCTVTEERNGIYELSMTILRTDRLSESVAVGMYIKVKANPHDAPQLFEVYQTAFTDNQADIKAQHVRYIANGNVISEAVTNESSRTGTPVEIWNYVQDLLTFNNPFNFESDITSSLNVPALKDRPIRLGDLLGGIDGSFLDTFGGEYHFDNFKISLLKNRGTSANVCLRYGSSISSYNQESNIDKVYTHLLPYAYLAVEDFEGRQKDYQLGLYCGLIELEGSCLTRSRALAYDFSEDFSEDKIILSVPGGPLNWDELTAKLRQKAGSYIIRNKPALTEIATNITIDVDDALQRLSKCGLCDVVDIYYAPLDVTATAKIIKLEYDVLNERYIKIELGSVKRTIADLIDIKNIGGA